MINKLSEFSSALIASVIALVIVEMILPNNKTKKYVTFVSSVILSITILNPIVSFLKKDISFDDFFEEEQYSISNMEYNAKMEYAKQKSIDDLYDESLKKNIINRLEECGYKVKDISFTVDRESYQPIKIQVEIEHSDGDVQKVIIDVSNNYEDNISLLDVAKVKDVLNSTYSIDRKNIIVNDK